MTTALTLLTNTSFFCRVLSHLLLVLSDADLHSKGQPFSTGAARAIATSLNALVYHTHFPRPAPQHQGNTLRPSLGKRVSNGLGCDDAGVELVSAATLGAGSRLLERYAPVALRGLYERDQRQPFCQPALWTAPYDAHCAASGAPPGGQQQQPRQSRVGWEQHSGLRAVTAVVQGLLFGGTAGTTDSQAVAAGASAGDGGLTDALPALGMAVAGSPSAMTALLRAAPQCVPFDVRLQLFR